MIKRLFYVLLTALLLGGAGFPGAARPTGKQIPDSIALTGGVYYSYEVPDRVLTPAPEGYLPVYISHYGRHGSRWHTSDKMYRGTVELFRKADREKALTPLGENVGGRVQRIAADAEGRAGDLSPRGVQEHRGIAERMYYNFPAVFSVRNGRAAHIRARSTPVPRCILSMAANNERLKELNPELDITREASRKYMDWLAPEEGMAAVAVETKPLMDSLKKEKVHPGRLVSSLFSDARFVRENIPDSVQFMIDMYMLASIMQNTDYLGISLYDLFTPEELFDIWEYYNYRMYVNNGPSPQYREKVFEDMKPLLRNIIENADRALETGETAADLRFGHDVFITPLACMMGLDDFGVQVTNPDSLYLKWKNFEISPMAANIQLIFYKKGSRDRRSTGSLNPGEDEVLVKILYNEKEMSLPVESAAVPYYSWKEVKRYFESLL